MRGVRWIPLAVLFLLFLNSQAAWADAKANLLSEGEVFWSASRQAWAVVSAGAAFFTVFVKGKERYRSSDANPYFKMGRLFVSDDGVHLVWMLSDYFYLQPDVRQMDEIPALIFYREGKPVASYRLGELLVRKTLVSFTTSHTQWIMERRNPDRSPGENAVSFSSDGSRLELETTSFRKYVFDPTTGKMLSGSDSEIFQKAEAIIFGKIAEVLPVKTGQSALRKLRISSFKRIKGKLPHTQSLLCLDPTGSYSQGWKAIALGRQEDEWVVLEPSWRLPVLYNVLPDESA